MRHEQADEGHARCLAQVTIVTYPQGITLSRCPFAAHSCKDEWVIERVATSNTGIRTGMCDEPIDQQQPRHRDRTDTEITGAEGKEGRWGYPLPSPHLLLWVRSSLSSSSELSSSRAAGHPNK